MPAKKHATVTGTASDSPAGYDSSRFIFVHFNISIDKAAYFRIESEIDELLHALRMKSIEAFDVIINHDWRAGVFSKPTDDDRQMLYYIVVDTPASHATDSAFCHRMEIFVDREVKAFIAGHTAGASRSRHGGM